MTSVITSTDSNIAELQFPNGARIDMACENLYILDGGSQSLIRLNLTSSLATLISSNAIGAGTSFIFRNILNIEQFDSNYLYAYAERYIFEVDKTTGDRVVLFDDGDIPGFDSTIRLFSRFWLHSKWPQYNQKFINGSNFR